MSINAPTTYCTNRSVQQVVEEPMCLKDIKKKLDNGEYSKYNQYTKFAQDMRKIWRNCKAYNLYKSQVCFLSSAFLSLCRRSSCLRGSRCF